MEFRRATLVIAISMIGVLFLVESCHRSEDNLFVVPGLQVLLTPQDFSIFSAHDGRVILQWRLNRDGSVAGYRVYRTQGHSSNPFRIIGTTQQNFFIDNQLDYDTTYFYKVTAFDTAGNESPPTPIVSAIPRNLFPPQQPTGFQAGAHNRDDGLYIQLSWYPNDEGDLAVYKIYRSLVDNFNPSSSAFLDTTSRVFYRDTLNIKVGTQYYYRITAVDRGNLESAPSEILNDIPLPRPVLLNPPDGAVITDTLKFEWNSVPNASSYIVFLTTSPCCSEIWKPQISASPGTRFSILYSGPSLARGVFYYWKVATVTTNAQDPNSVSVTRKFFLQ